MRAVRVQGFTYRMAQATVQRQRQRQRHQADVFRPLVQCVAAALRHQGQTEAQDQMAKSGRRLNDATQNRLGTRTRRIGVDRICALCSGMRDDGAGLDAGWMAKLKPSSIDIHRRSLISFSLYRMLDYALPVSCTTAFSLFFGCIKIDCSFR